MNKTIEQSFAEQGLKMFFVLPNDQEMKDAPHEFKEAYERSMEKNITPELITESKIKKLTITKKMVVVVQHFSGSLFTDLRKSPCLLLGPRCLLDCLMKGVPTPEGPHPVFTLAMKDITVCISGLTPAQKVTRNDLKEKVEFMGGRVVKDLSDRVTHLVATSVDTQKYTVAAEKGLPVMQESWVHESWELSQRQSIHALDPPLSSLTCPTFLGLRVCVSQIPKQRKEKIRQMVESKGGKYSPTLTENETDVLVVGSSSSDKIMHAKKWKVPCVSEQWVSDSLNAGYNLKYASYEINPQRSSTPDKNQTFVDPNFSMMSCISGGRNQVDETICSEASFLEPGPRDRQSLQVPHKVSKTPQIRLEDYTLSSKDPKTPEKVASSDQRKEPPESRSSKQTSVSDTLRLIEKLQMSDVKKAGAFLDGCKVYLSGFSPSLLDKVRRILNCGGATRFDDISEGVSHVLVAGEALTSEETLSLRQGAAQPHVVRVQWLLASLDQRHPASTETFLCYDDQQSTEPSPLSKKGLQMWKKEGTVVPSPSTAAAAHSDIQLVKQYIQFDDPDRTQLVSPGKSKREEEEGEELAVPLADEEPEEQSTVQDETSDEHERTLFQGLKFWGAGITKEESAMIKECVVRLGGEWLPKQVDYLVVPTEGAKCKTQAKNTITCVWIEECMERQELLEVQYYHRPLDVVKGVKPLKDCVIGLSSYIGRERTFLSLLAKELGALFQEVFAKKRAPERNAEASTHLLCPAPGGSKYAAAIKWKLPVVTKDWLLACGQDGVRHPEEPFLIEGSTIEPLSKPQDNNVTKNSTTSEISSVNMVSTSVRTSADSGGVPKPSDPKPAPEISSPISAIPSRLRIPAIKTSETETNCETREENYNTSTTPNLKPADNITKMSNDTNNLTPNLKTVTPNFKTPNTSKTSLTPNRSVQFNTPAVEFKTPSQPYTPYTPAPPRPEETKVTPKETKTSEVDVSKLTPKSYNNYWDSKVPGNIPTPDTPYGQVLKSNPSASTKKAWKNYTDDIPDEFQTPVSKNRKRSHGPAASATNSKKDKHTEEAESDEEGDETALGGDTEEDNYSLDGPSLGVKRKQETPDEPPVIKKTVLAGHRESVASPQPGPATGSPVLRRKQENSGEQKDSDTQVQDKKNGTKSFKFMLTGVDDPERSQLDQLIEELGGELSTTTSYDPTATHLIMAKPVRSEKLLASIASGKWILHHSFLLECHKRGQFVPEEQFEWGNPKAITLPSQKPGSLDHLLSSACYRWRSKLQGAFQGAYSGMKAIIYCQPGKSEAFTRLVQAGGGEVVNAKPPFTDPAGATHCFADLSRQPPVDLKGLAARKVPFLNAIYLNDFLLRDPPPSPEEWRQENLNKSRTN